MITSWEDLCVPNFTKIGRRVFPRRIRNMFILRWHFFFVFFWVHQSGYSRNRWTDFHAWYVKRTGLGQGGAFRGSKILEKNLWTPKGGKNPLSHAFQWETKMPITFDPVDRSSRNLVYSIRAIGASMLYAHKPEIPKTKWPPTPSWIFRQTLITRDLFIRLSPNFSPRFLS